MNQTAHNVEQHPSGKQPELEFTRRFERGLFGSPKSVAVTLKLRTKRPLPLGDLLYRMGRSPRFHLSSVLNDVLPEELTNLRGRPPESFSKLEDPPPEGQEEILFVKGRMLNTLKEAAQDYDENFELKLRTKFARFIGSQQIVYALTSEARFPSAEESMPEPVAFIGFSVPLEISELRVGFELFSARFVGAFLGIAPIIKTRFYLNAAGSLLELFIEGEQENGFPKLLEPDVAELEKILNRNGIEVELLKAMRDAA